MFWKFLTSNFQIWIILQRENESRASFEEIYGKHFLSSKEWNILQEKVSTARFIRYNREAVFPLHLQNISKALLVCCFVYSMRINAPWIRRLTFPNQQISRQYEYIWKMCASIASTGSLINIRSFNAPSRYSLYSSFFTGGINYIASFKYER